MPGGFSKAERYKPRKNTERERKAAAKRSKDTDGKKLKKKSKARRQARMNASKIIWISIQFSFVGLHPRAISVCLGFSRFANSRYKFSVKWWLN